MPVIGYDKILSEVNAMLQADRIMIPAVNSLLAVQRKRIFQDGKATNNQKIGTYSTNPISISKSKQSRNTGKTYFKGGYRQYKSLTGKGSNYVNLRNTDQMRMDLCTMIVGRHEYGIGFSNQFNKDKSEWNEEHFKKLIFETTDQEDDLVMKVIEFELNKL